MLGAACAPPAPKQAVLGTPAPPPAAVAKPQPEPVWIADLERELTALRGLPFKWQVPFGAQTEAAFRAKVRGDLAHELPTAKSADVSRSYTALGLAGTGFDLSKAMEEALATQVAAYYDPEVRSFKVIGSNLALEDPKHATVISHELMHALQDQYFDLQRFAGEHDQALDDDERLARRFVTEGEATFMMMAHGMGSGRPAERKLGSWTVAGLRMGTRVLAAMDMLEMAADMRQGEAPDQLDPKARADMEALARLPPVVTVPLCETYFKGAEMISEVWAAGGWPAVDALYRHPPDSTEQALHPAEKLIARRDPPVRLAAAVAPPVAGARLLESEVVGELGWRAYFKTWSYREPEEAAAGWGGDRYWAWAVGDRTLTLMATTWDAESDAARFFLAYEATLATRFPRATLSARGASGLRLVQPDGRGLVVARSGRDVQIISGAGPEELTALEATLRSIKRTRDEERPHP